MAHCNAQAVQYIPSSFVGHTELCHQLDSRAAALIDLEQISCRKQISATSGTVFHGTHIKLNLWLWAMFAAVESADSNHAELTSSTVRADKPMREAKPEEQLAAALLGAVPG